MKLNTKVLLLVFVAMAWTITSCDQDSGPVSGYQIKGTLANAGGKTIFLDQMSLNSSTPFDTAIIANDGKFEMRGEVPERGLYMLRVDQDHTWLMVLDNEKLVFTGDFNDMLNYSFKGSAAAEDLATFIQNIGSQNKKISDLRQQYNEQTQSGNPDANVMQEIQQQFIMVSSNLTNSVHTYADTVQDPLLKVFAASLLSPEQNLDFLTKINDELQKEIPNTVYAREFNAKISEASKLAIGSMAPDFTLSGPDGKDHKLSDLRGKIVLVDFWASWCKPCRAENPNLVRTYNEYKDKGFTVYSVSLDKDLNRWVQAIKADGLSWESHGSNLVAWNCPIAHKYNVTSIPQAFLLDRDGRIIAKGLRGSQLEQKLAEIFAEP